MTELIGESHSVLTNDVHPNTPAVVTPPVKPPMGVLWTDPVVECRGAVIRYEREAGTKQLDAKGVRTEAVSIQIAGWGELTEALFFGPGVSMSIPATDALCRLGSFAVEMVVCPLAGGNLKADLIASKVTPFTLSLTPAGDGYALKARLFVKRRAGTQVRTDWVEVKTATAVPCDAWSRVAVVFDGGDLVLLINGDVQARRVISAAELTLPEPAPPLEYVVGSNVQRSSSSIRIAGARIWNTVPAQLLGALHSAERQGVGAIDSYYGDVGESLGAATGPETPIAGGHMRNYEKGAIYWSARTGAHAVLGASYAFYRQPRIQTNLGFPRADEQNGRSAGSRVSVFENGAIYCSAATGYGAVWGSAYARYRALDAEVGKLGLPVSIASGPASNLDQQVVFQKGRMFTNSSEQSFEVAGPVLDHYVKLGGPSGLLGLPTSAEEQVCKGRGVVQRFASGAIYCSSKTGAFEVHGAIGKTYQTIGGPSSDLGFPVTDERQVANTDICYSGFEKGVIVYRPSSGTRIITEIELYLDKVAQRGGIIVDGKPGGDGGDNDFEMYSRVTVKASGKPLENNARMPASGHPTRVIEWNKKYHIPIRHDTTIELHLEYYDWDMVGSDEHLGDFDRVFDVSNLWGSGNTGAGQDSLHLDQPLTRTRDPNPHDGKPYHRPGLDHGCLLTSFRIGNKAAQVDENQFRNQAWWSYANKGNAPLDMSLFTQTFQDTSYIAGVNDVILNAVDAFYYEVAFKNIAKDGNCSGMSTEAMHSLMGTSIFAEHISPYSQSETLSRVNIKQAYQLGTDSILWILGQILSGACFSPIGVYASARDEIRRCGACILSFFNLQNMTGHSVLAYRYEDLPPGPELGRLFVADPNKPWKGSPGHPSFVRIMRQNAFMAETITTKSNDQGFGSHLGSYMIHTPYSVVSRMPRTPAGEISALLSLLGGLILLAGDAEPEQVSLDGQQLFVKTNGYRHVVAGGVKGFGVVPLIDVAGDGPRVFASNRPMAGDIRLDLRGRRGTAARPGEYRKLLAFPASAVEITNPIVMGSQDIVDVTDVDSAFPKLSLHTGDVLKSAAVRLSVLLDANGRDSRSFSLALQQGRGEVASVQADPRGGGLLASPAGPARPFDVSIDVRDGGSLKRSIVRGLLPGAAGEVVRLAPVDWTAPAGEVMVERLSSIGGAVLKREIVRGTDR